MIILLILIVILLGILVYLLYLFIQKYTQMANYPLPVYHFSVQWGGRRESFTEVRGLDKLIEPIRVRDGASSDHKDRMMPGLEKYNTITFRRTIEKGDLDFYLWMNTKVGSTIERRDITIHLLGEDHEPVFTWRIINAFPIRYSGPVFLASNSDSAYEELEIVHEGLTVQS
jgi:phage tail-like protein